MQQPGRTAEVADRLLHPGDEDRMPVLYVTVPPSSAAAANHPERGDLRRQPLGGVPAQ
ncbi:hypothetical protein [Kitasatospora sp. NPDC050463]|uniref:hypothetical protein n=1 Tax=Kitasatospora sp. NPDC050463 TaxID=3155786 RepID=UPI0033CE5D02